MINKNIWEKVSSVEQLKEGSIIKIVGLASKNSYKRVSVKKVLNMKNTDGNKWVEIVINLKKNYYFNLSAYLKNEPTFGGWVKDLYVKL